MNIAVLIRSRTLSGAEKRAAKIARALESRGHQVICFMDADTVTALIRDDYRFEWPPVVTLNYPQWLQTLSHGRSRLAGPRAWLGVNHLERWARRIFWRKLFYKYGIQVAHIYMKSEFCKNMPIPHIFEITSPDMARTLIRQPDPFVPETLLHPNSESVDAVLHGFFPKNKKIVSPHAFFDPNEECVAYESEKENLVVFGHRLIERKNPVVFARAAKRFLEARQNWRVAIRGAGEFADEVCRILTDEIDAGRAAFGYQANLMDELRKSKIFVSIESEDNYSNQSVLEAMWCRNALILSDRGNTRVRYFSENGILCEPTEESVFEALMTLSADQARINLAGEKSRRHVEKAFNREKYLEHLEGVYLEALQGV